MFVIFLLWVVGFPYKTTEAFHRNKTGNPPNIYIEIVLRRDLSVVSVEGTIKAPNSAFNVHTAM